MKKSPALFLTFLFAIVGHVNVQASESKKDSLWLVAQAEHHPLKRADAFLTYATQLNTSSNRQALVLMDSLIGFYREENLKIALGRALSLKMWFLNYSTEYEEAIRIGYEALELLKKEKDSLGIAQTLNRIGVTNIYFKRFETAESYLKEALAYFIALKDTVRIDVLLNNLGVVAQEQKQATSALSYYRQSLALRKQLGNSYWIAYSYSNIAGVFEEQGVLDSAKKYVELAISTFQNETDQHRVPALACSMASSVYRAMGDYEQALNWAEKAIEASEKVGQIDALIEATKSKAEIYAKQGNYEAAYKVGLTYQKMQATLDSTNNHAQVAEIESRYKTAEKEVHITKLEAEKVAAESSARRSWIVALVVGLATALIIFLLIVIYQKRLQDQRIQKSELKAQISEIKMLALRAQMNPHFIFNCINTTQNFVLNSDKVAAYEYLSMFAKLLRLVLENSNKTLISLEDELTQLELYVELEAVRFSHMFHYEIEVDPGLKNGVFEIPGMLIQPLVENALLNGLVNRGDEKGFLKVKFEKQGEYLYCEVTDNGVGRAKASAIKAAKKMHYQSAALPNILERLKIMQRGANDQNIKLELIDLEEGDTACGTQARLYIPFG